MNQSAEIHALICCSVRSLSTPGLTQPERAREWIHKELWLEIQETQEDAKYSLEGRQAGSWTCELLMLIHQHDWLADSRVTSSLEISNKESQLPDREEVTGAARPFAVRSLSSDDRRSPKQCRGDSVAITLAAYAKPNFDAQGNVAGTYVGRGLSFR